MASWPSTRDPKGPMKRSIGILNKQKIQSQDADGLPESAKRFADGSRYKIQIPSVEGPAAFKTVVDEAKKGQYSGREKLFIRVHYSAYKQQKFVDLEDFVKTA